MAMGQIMARFLPEDAIISEEAATTGGGPDQISARQRAA